MAFLIEFSARYGLFSRPEMKTERCSYDVITASAARGMLEAIYWHPGMRWVVDQVHVLSPIRFTNIRRNEVKDVLRKSNALYKANHPETPFALYTHDSIQQRAALVLSHPHYVIRAHFEMTEKAGPGDTEGKFSSIIKRRLEKGQCYSTPYMGTREFSASFAAWPEDRPIPAIQETQDLGYMLLDLDFTNSKEITPIFHRIQMINGVVSYPDPQEHIEKGGGEIYGN